MTLDADKSKKETQKPPSKAAARSASEESSSSTQASPAKVPEPQKAGGNKKKRAQGGNRNTDQVKKRRFYEGWKLKKKAHEPKSPEKQISPDHKKDNDGKKKRRGLQHSQSDRQQPRATQVRRAPSDMTGTKPSMTRRSLPREPRETFLNMRTRPLPQAPYALPDEPPEHTLADYDIVDKMLPPPQRAGMPTGPAVLPAYLQQRFPAAPISSSHPAQRQRSQSQDFFSYDNMDYMNDDQFPIPSGLAAVHPFTATSMQSLPPSSSHPSSFSPTAGSVAQPLIGGWSQSPTHPFPPTHSHSPIQSLPPSFQHLSRQTVEEPAHPPNVPHPLPRQQMHPHHTPLSRSTSHPQRDHSPDYSYPRIPALDLMQRLPFRAPGATNTRIPRSKSTEEEEYVQMKLVSNNDDAEYENQDTIDTIRAMKRSRSIGDIHEYQNFPITREPTVFDRTMPLPSRSPKPPTAQQTFVLPPRNVPRWKPSPNNSLERDSGMTGLLSPSQTLSPVKSLPGSMNLLPLQAAASSGSPTPLQPWLSPRPIPKMHPRMPQPSPSSFFSPHTSSPSHSQHVITTSPPPAEAPRESPPPHLEYVPKFKSTAHSSPLVGPATTATTDSRAQGPNFNPSVESPRKIPVGTSTWTAEDDPNYYNVVSKSFLFSKPRSPESGGDYLDIVS